VLKFLEEFMEAGFLGVTQKLLLDTPSVWTGHSKNQTRVQSQEVRNSLSDRWIVLNFLQEFQEACFLGVAMKSP
jgi:tagatose-1,6-bisphosphate aldolase non-catalytic subunit AgaZ/GatZ